MAGGREQNRSSEVRNLVVATILFETWASFRNNDDKDLIVK